MAVMTSQPEPITLDEKSQSLNMATSTSPAPNGDKRNGDGLEVNGHASPADSQTDATSTTKSAQQDNAPSQDELKNTEVSNKDAFASNQSISAMTPPNVEAVSANEAPSTSETTNRPEETNKEADTEMVDAPVESAKPPSPPAEPVAGTAGTEDKSAEAEATIAVKSENPAESPVDTAVKVESNNDKSNEKSNASVPEPAADAEETGNTQATDASEVGPSDLISPTVSMSKMGLSASQDDATAPLTADTSMTDAPSQSSAKVARERDEDDDDEPMAKRARTSAEQAAASAGPDAMAVDQPPRAPAPSSGPTVSGSKPTNSPAPLSVDGKTRYLNDRALDNNPITSYQNREIRKVLGLVKKTKSGQHFRQPVQALWPTVWDQYRQLIERPVDISFIEQNLRDGRYSTMAQFRKDVDLLQQNATTFNGATHDVTAWAANTVVQINERLATIPAQEPSKPVKQEPKQMPTRHAEPRVPPPAKAKEPRATVTSPAEKSSDNQIYALLPSGLPNIRRDSTKNDGDRPKRPIHPPKNKDLGMAPKSGKNKKKPELRFCEEVLKEVLHQKNWQQNQWFTAPVDPVALNIPTYHSVIKQPMDLGTMNEKLQRGEYETAKDFKSDFNLIVKNCVKFNGDAHPVTDAVKQLETIFEKKWSEKSSWMSKHAQSPARVATSPRGGAREESDEEDASEPEQDNGEELKEAQRAVNAVTERLKQEQAELDKKLYSDNPDMSAIETHRTIINFLTTEMVTKRQALNKLQDSKKTSQPKTSSKKKAGGATGGGGGSGSGASKKAGGGGVGGSKKSGGGGAAKKPAKKKLTDEEKEIVSEAIGRLDGGLLDKAITIIKKDAKLEATDDDELELDMDQLSDDALVKLYELVLKQFPEYKNQLKKSNPAPTPGATQSSKPKKNKPMGKDEQERKLQQLRELKDSYKRPGSGSQEPLPSVENNDHLHSHDQDDSDDASSSEEE